MKHGILVLSVVANVALAVAAFLISPFQTRLHSADDETKLNLHERPVAVAAPAGALVTAGATRDCKEQLEDLGRRTSLAVAELAVVQREISVRLTPRERWLDAATDERLTMLALGVIDKDVCRSSGIVGCDVECRGSVCRVTGWTLLHSDPRPLFNWLHSLRSSPLGSIALGEEMVSGRATHDVARGQDLAAHDVYLHLPPDSSAALLP